MIHLIAGVPGSGKTYLLQKLLNECQDIIYMAHDIFSTDEYPKALYEADNAFRPAKPILAECPFRASVLEQQLIDRGCKVQIYYLVEPLALTIKRYEERSGKTWQKAFNTNWHKYNERSPKYNQEELFKHLVSVLSTRG